MWHRCSVSQEGASSFHLSGERGCEAGRVGGSGSHSRLGEPTSGAGYAALVKEGVDLLESIATVADMGVLAAAVGAA